MGVQIDQRRFEKWYSFSGANAGRSWPISPGERRQRSSLHRNRVGVFSVLLRPWPRVARSSGPPGQSTNTDVACFEQTHLLELTATGQRGTTGQELHARLPRNPPRHGLWHRVIRPTCARLQQTRLVRCAICRSGEACFRSTRTGMSNQIFTCVDCGQHGGAGRAAAMHEAPNPLSASQLGGLPASCFHTRFFGLLRRPVQSGQNSA